jgi:phage terminase large subunit
LAELKSYCWNKSEPNIPEDKNNHLMDAMRYAFYDVKNKTEAKVLSYNKTLKGEWDL